MQLNAQRLGAIQAAAPNRDTSADALAQGPPFAAPTLLTDGGETCARDPRPGLSGTA